MFYEYTAKLFLSFKSLYNIGEYSWTGKSSLVLFYELCFLYEVLALVLLSALAFVCILDCLYATNIQTLIEVMITSLLSLLAYEIFILKQLPKGPVVKACDHALQLYIEFQLGKRMVDET